MQLEGTINFISPSEAEVNVDKLKVKVKVTGRRKINRAKENDVVVI